MHDVHATDPIISERSNISTFFSLWLVVNSEFRLVVNDEFWLVVNDEFWLAVNHEFWLVLNDEFSLVVNEDFLIKKVLLFMITFIV